MVSLSREERIKQRDRWTCKRCGKRFENLVIWQFILSSDKDDNFITFCKTCLEWASNNIKKAKELSIRLLRRNKIVLIGDCHGRFDRLDKILAEEEPFDFFISVGDVGTLADVTPNNLGIFDKWKTRGYFVYGNHDDVQFFNRIRLNQEINGLHIAGLNGMLRTRNFIKDTPNNVSFREVLYLSHLNDVDILVTHQPPTGVFKGMGEPVLEELLNYLVPKIYIFGHIHHYKLKFHLNTFIISLPLITRGHAVAYFQGKELKNLEIVLKKGKKFIRV